MVKFLSRLICCCAQSKSSYQYQWEFERAPEPSDIYWENLGTSTGERICRSMWSFMLTAFLILICLGVISAIKSAQMTHLEKEMENGKSFKE